MKIEESTRLPKDWHSFLRVDDNKMALFGELRIAYSKTLVVTKHRSVITNNGDFLHTSELAPCNHEESDTRVFLHCKHAYNQGYRRIIVIATDNVCISFMSYIPDSEIRIDYGRGKHQRYITTHDIYTKFSNNRSKALPFFHSFTGCDTTSPFNGIGKRTAWDTWNAFADVTPAFVELYNLPRDISNTGLSIILRFVVLMYRRTSCLTDVNTARIHLFSSGNRQIENIPPTEACLIQHIKRAAYQAGYVWRQSLQALQSFPSPGEWGWVMQYQYWQPLWNTLHEASKVCRELIMCSYIQGCMSYHCACRRSNLNCTHLCQYASQCAFV